MKKYFAAILILVLVCSTFSLTASAGSEFVHDNSNVLTNSQEEELNAIANELFSKTQAKFYVVTVGAMYYEGENFLYSNGLNEYEDIVLLVINTYELPTIYYDIYTYGDAYNKITDAEIDRLVYNDQVYDNLKGGEIFEGAKAYLALGETAYSGHLRAKTSTIIITSVIIALIAASIAVIAVVISYKTKKKSANYPLDKYAKLDLTEKKDIFMGSSVSRVRIQSNSGGRSGGSGRGGGGGHRGGA